VGEDIVPPAVVGSSPLVVVGEGIVAVEEGNPHLGEDRAAAELVGMPPVAGGTIPVEGGTAPGVVGIDPGA